MTYLGRAVILVAVAEHELNVLDAFQAGRVDVECQAVLDQPQIHGPLYHFEIILSKTKSTSGILLTVSYDEQLLLI